MEKKKLLYFFSNIRIFNCIILIQVLYVISKKLSRPMNFNDVDTDMK